MMNADREWRPVKGYEGLYAVSDNGDVWSRRAGKCLALCVGSCQYFQVTLYKDGGKKSFFVHTLVASAFLENPGLPSANHIDGIKTNNSKENLEWASWDRQVSHAVELGLRDHRGERNTKAKFTEETVRKIRARYQGGEKIMSLCREFGVLRQCIKHIVTGVTWGHI